MKKRMTLVVLLNDEVEGPDAFKAKPLASKTNEEWAVEMREVFGQEPSMELVSVTVEDV